MLEIAWNIALIVCAIFFIAFTFVVAFGAPYLPTLKSRVPEALDLANLKPGQTLLELGSGDGRLLIEAAKRGVNSVGYELNPILVLISKIRCYKYRKKIKIIWGNYWQKEWPKANAIFVFLLQPYMEKLDTQITQKYPGGIKLVSFAFTIDSKKPTKEVNGLYLYKYDKLDLCKTSPSSDNANDEVVVVLSGGSDAKASLTAEKLAGRVGGVSEEVRILRKSSKVLKKGKE